MSRNLNRFISFAALSVFNGLLVGCDATGLATDDITPVAQVVQVQGAEVIMSADGQYEAPASNRIEKLPAAVQLNGSLPYPSRTGFDIKSLHTDFWPNRQELVDADVSGVIANLVWETWQPSQQTACTGNQIKYDGYCYTIEVAYEDYIRYWSDQGKTVTAVLYGVPAWARNSDCVAPSSDTEKFCSARDPNDYARFVGMIAERYNGLNGKGRISDFIIHNEVNMNQWYKVGGCGQGVPCDQSRWIEDYASNFNAAYDRIMAVQPDARVLVPFAHQFDTNFDNATGSNPIISVKTFIRGVNGFAAGRKWRMAYHPYHKRLDSAEASYDDMPRVTFGNIGVLSGWLRQEFPNQPESWEVYLTENGVSSNGRSDEYSQDIAVCNSYRNVLGTPGIKNYVYHRMQDNSYEAERGAAFGLRREDGSAKPVWDKWSIMSDQSANQLDCGFENLPYTKLSSFSNSTGDRRSSSRVVGNNYGEVDSWFLLRDHEPNTYMAYECKAGSSSYISTDAYCGGAHSYGPVGYVHEYQSADRVGLFTCSNGTQVYSSDEYACAGNDIVEFIGYVKKYR